MLGLVNVGGPAAQITMMYNHMVERRHWLSKDRFEKIIGFCHMLPGPEALQLAIYIGYLKRRIQGGLLAGLLFMLPGAILMTILARLYVTYGRLPQVDAVLVVLKPAVIGIITAGAIKLGAGAIRNLLLAGIMVVSAAALSYSQTNLLIILLVAGLVNLLVSQGWLRFRKRLAQTRVVVIALLPLISIHPHWLRMSWLFLKTGLFSFGGAYASLAFLQQGAVEEYRWVSVGQFLDGVALSVATPGPFMLFATFVGYLAGGVRGAVVATFFVFLPSFVFILAGARYIEKLRDNEAVQAFLAGVSAALVGIIISVSLQLAPVALMAKGSVVIGILAFLAIVLLKVDVALVAVAAIIGGIVYAFLL